LKINEVNHTMEFHSLAPTTGIDIAGIIVDYTLAVGQGKIKPQAPSLAAATTPRVILPVYAAFDAGLAGYHA
jgi:hypothetical protein